MRVQTQLQSIAMMFCLACAPAYAAEETEGQLYIGVTALHSDEMDSTSDAATGGELYMGAGLNHWFAIEIGAGSYGEFESATGKWVLNHARLSLVAKDALTEYVHAFAKLSAVHSEQQWDPIAAGADEEGDALGWSYQLGLSLPLGQHFSIDTHIQHLNIDYYRAAVKARKLNSVGLGFQVHF